MSNVRDWTTSIKKLTQFQCLSQSFRNTWHTFVIVPVISCWIIWIMSDFRFQPQDSLVSMWYSTAVLKAVFPFNLGFYHLDPFRVYICLAWNSGFTALITSFEYHISWRSSVHFSEPPHCACGKRSPAILQAMILQLASAHFDLWWRTATKITNGGKTLS